MSISGINYFMTNLVAQSARASASIVCRAEHRRLEFRLTRDFFFSNHSLSNSENYSIY